MSILTLILLSLVFYAWSRTVDQLSFLNLDKFYFFPSGFLACVEKLVA